jgi:superfamily II DNA or RNA helicase
VLSERIKHLQVFEAGLLARGIPKESIAYYVGGMKEGPREAGAARARVLLASYQMASEAMNIKTLNTVVLASPRKKIEQSTGRILRTRKEDRVVMPLIVDVVDSHPGYQRRWMKRRQHYKTCAYTIVDAGSASAVDAGSASTVAVDTAHEDDKDEEETDTDEACSQSEQGESVRPRGGLVRTRNLGGCMIMDD